jgi:hypothetical protein
VAATQDSTFDWRELGAPVTIKCPSWEYVPPRRT